MSRFINLQFHGRRHYAIHSLPLLRSECCCNDVAVIMVSGAVASVCVVAAVVVAVVFVGVVFCRR